MEMAVLMVAIGVWGFLVFSAKDCVRSIADSRVKIAEANARAEEARTEHAKIELARAKFERDNTLV